MYTKAGPVLDNLLPDSAEALADVLLGISKSLAAQDDFALAVTWLDRAKSIIDGQDLERLSREAVELKLAINQALVTALISLPNATGIDRAEDVLRELETLGSPLVVLLLRLEVIQRKPAENFDDATYASLIRALLKTVKSPEGGGEQSASRLMQLIHHHIRKLHQKSPSLGCRLQDELIDSVRTVKDDCWLEKMIVFRFWMASQQRTAEDTIRELSEILTRLDQPLSPEAAMSVQALVSAKLEGEGEPAGPWCALALHPRLEKSGPANMQKLENRLLLDAISRGDMDAAMAVVHERGLMDRAKTDAMACYLIFKVALRTQDHGLAVECIEILGSGPQQQEYLSACVADAQQCGNGAVAVASMKELVERFEYQASTSLHLPALLRCMIRILHGLMEAEQTELGRSRISEDVVLAFDAVLCAIEKHPSLFDAREINWFSRTGLSAAE